MALNHVMITDQHTADAMNMAEEPLVQPLLDLAARYQAILDRAPADTSALHASISDVHQLLANLAENKTRRATYVKHATRIRY